MAIEIGGRGPGERELTPAVIMPGGGRDWPAFMLKLGIVSLVVAVILSAVLFVWQNLILSKRLAGINSQIASLEAAQQSQDAQKFVVVQSQLRALREILTNHVYASKAFSWLESLTHKQVSFSNIAVNFEQGRMSLNGVAASNDVLAQQIEIFENDTNVIQTELNGIELGAQGVNFALSVQFETSLVSR